MRVVKYFLFGLLACCFLVTDVLGADGDQKWMFTNTSYSSINFNPVSIAPDGTVYATGSDAIFTLNPNGSVKWWEYTSGLGDSILGSAAIGPDGTIYVGVALSKYYGHDGLYAYNPAGDLKWIFDKGGDVRHTPAISTDGTIYVVTEDDREPNAVPALYALNPDGTEKWAYAEGTRFTNSPVIDYEGNVIILANNTIHSIRPNGTLNWSTSISEAYNPQPLSVADDGSVYFSFSGRIMSFSQEGDLKWTFESSASSTLSAPAIDEEGNLYFGSSDKYAYALDENGSLKWTYEVTNNISNTPAIGKDGTVIFTGQDYSANRIYAFSGEGSLKWSVTSYKDLQSPVIADDGTLYVTSHYSDGYVLAYETSTGGALDVGWPMVGHDARHSSSGEPRALSAVPDEPQISYTTNGINLHISWSSVPTATGYILNYAPYPYTGPETISSIDLRNQTHFSYDLWDGATYYIAVQAYNYQGQGGYSNIEHFIIEQINNSNVDNDGDGYTESQGDCNDSDITIYPSAAEICGDGIDQNCDALDSTCSVTTGYTDNYNGTVTDNSTGLTWQQSDDGVSRDWQTAIDYCSTLTLGGSKNWRLPNIEELESLIEGRFGYPSIDHVFAYTISDNHWSSTSHTTHTLNAWYVHFYSGQSSYGSKSASSPKARCVR